MSNTYFIEERKEKEQFSLHGKSSGDNEESGTEASADAAGTVVEWWRGVGRGWWWHGSTGARWSWSWARVAAGWVRSAGDWRAASWLGHAGDSGSGSRWRADGGGESDDAAGGDGSAGGSLDDVGDWLGGLGSPGRLLGWCGGLWWLWLGAVVLDAEVGAVLVLAGALDDDHEAVGVVTGEIRTRSPRELAGVRDVLSKSLNWVAVLGAAVEEHDGDFAVGGCLPGDDVRLVDRDALVEAWGAEGVAGGILAVVWRSDGRDGGREGSNDESDLHLVLFSFGGDVVVVVVVVVVGIKSIDLERPGYRKD